VVGPEAHGLVSTPSLSGTASLALAPHVALIGWSMVSPSTSPVVSASVNALGLIATLPAHDSLVALRRRTPPLPQRA
jgi:hypothetical protein